MAIGTEQSAAVSDISAIKPGDLLYGRHQSWKEGKAGFVTRVTEKYIAIQYYPGIANITNHYFIPFTEAAAGEWEIRYSTELSEVYEYRNSKGGE